MYRVSTSSDLRIDAARDLVDVVGDDWIPVLELSQDYGPMPHEGVCFLTYSKLASMRRGEGGGGRLRSRFDQLVAWATRRGKEPFDGCLLFDESHRAKALYTGAGAQSQAALVRGCVRAFDWDLTCWWGVGCRYACLHSHPPSPTPNNPNQHTTPNTARDAPPRVAPGGPRHLLLRHGRHGAPPPRVHEPAGPVGPRHDLPRRVRELSKRRHQKRGRGDGGGLGARLRFWGLCAGGGD